MGKPKTKICKECGQSKRLKAFRADRDVCKDCSSQAKHPDKGVKPTIGVSPAWIKEGDLKWEYRLEWILPDQGAVTEYIHTIKQRQVTVRFDGWAIDKFGWQIRDVPQFTPSVLKTIHAKLHGKDISWTRLDGPRELLYVEFCKLPFGGNHKRKVTQLPEIAYGSKIPRAQDDSRNYVRRNYTERLLRAIKEIKETQTVVDNPKTVYHPPALGYIADHVSSQVGRRITIRPEKRGKMYDPNKGPYDVRELAKCRIPYERGDKIGEDHIEWQNGKGKLVKARRKKGCWVRPPLLGQMVASQSGNVKYLGNGWYETEPGGKGVGEAIDSEGYVVERAQPIADTGHPGNKISPEAALEYHLLSREAFLEFAQSRSESIADAYLRELFPQFITISPAHQAWKEEMIKARSNESDSLMAEVLEELESIPVNEQNEQPYLPSDGSTEYEEQKYDRDYFGRS